MVFFKVPCKYHEALLYTYHLPWYYHVILYMYFAIAIFLEVPWNIIIDKVTTMAYLKTIVLLCDTFTAPQCSTFFAAKNTLLT